MFMAYQYSWQLVGAVPVGGTEPPAILPRALRTEPKLIGGFHGTGADAEQPMNNVAI